MSSLTEDRAGSQTLTFSTAGPTFPASTRVITVPWNDGKGTVNVETQVRDVRTDQIHSEGRATFAVPSSAVAHKLAEMFARLAEQLEA